MKNKYVFILTITVICSLLLSLVSEVLKERQDKNIAIDRKKNILSAVGVNIAEFSILDIDQYFIDNIDTLIITPEGSLVNNISIESLLEEENSQTGEIKYFDQKQDEFLPIYTEKLSKAIILPVSGKGLWGSLYGYFALDADNFSTVKGITFYKHKETPGLGAEISEKWFQSNFIGKEIYDNSILTSINVTKAGLADKAALHEVDGISGATITSNGVADLLKRDLKRYEPYFIKNKK